MKNKKLLFGILIATVVVVILATIQFLSITLSDETQRIITTFFKQDISTETVNQDVSIEPVSQDASTEMTNFGDCAEAGYPILMTQPRQCKTPDGRTFTEELAVEIEESPIAPIVSYGGAVIIIDSLLATGALVEPVGEISQLFFSVKGFGFKVNDEIIQTFEYMNAAAADAKAALVSPDGSSVGTSMNSSVRTSLIRWAAAPHFYKKERLIVLYVGDTVAIMDALESALGPQFAGR